MAERDIATSSFVEKVGEMGNKKQKEKNSFPCHILDKSSLRKQGHTKEIILEVMRRHLDSKKISYHY